MLEKSLINTDNIKYLKHRFKELDENIKKSYDYINELYPLFRDALSYIFIDFRDYIDPNSFVPYRVKNRSSLNTKMENAKKALILDVASNPNYTKEEIEKKFSKMNDKLMQDIFGATLVLFTDNRIKQYCETSANPKIQILCQQLKKVEHYLNSENELGVYTSPFSLKEPLSYIDITDTFIDDFDLNPNTPTKVPPLNISDIKTWKDYYTQLVSLLTLLTNISTPCNFSSDGKEHKYCVGQIKFPFLKLLQFEDFSKYSPSDAIKNLLTIAQKNYDGCFIPFDEQLDYALKAQADISKTDKYNTDLLPNDLLKCKLHLRYLKENLEKLSNDRLSSYVLEHDLPKIIENISMRSLKEQTPLQIDKINSYTKARSNSYVSTYLILNVNKLFNFEFQLITQLRYRMGLYGNSAHNDARANKSLSIKNLFKPKNPSLDKDSFNMYLDFLNSIDINYLELTNCSEEDLPARNYLLELVDYAISQVEIVDELPSKANDSCISFYDYIHRILAEKTATHGKVSAAHNIKSNEARIVENDEIYLLQRLLTSRMGFTKLANMVLYKYQEEAIKRGRTDFRADASSINVSRDYLKLIIPQDAAQANKMLQDDNPNASDKEFIKMISELKNEQNDDNPEASDKEFLKMLDELKNEQKDVSHKGKSNNNNENER